MLRGHMKCCPSAVNIFLLKGHTIPYLVRNVWYLVRNMWLPSRCTSYSPSAPYPHPQPPTSLHLLRGRGGGHSETAGGFNIVQYKKKKYLWNRKNCEIANGCPVYILSNVKVLSYYNKLLFSNKKG